MRKMSRIILYAILFISLIVGMFPALVNSVNYYILYSLLFVFNLLFIALNFKERMVKIDYSFFIVLILMLVGVLFRSSGGVMHAVAILNVLLSYYSLSLAKVDAKIISWIIAIALIPTIVFNGIFNINIESNTSFAGRLNPLMYLPYVMLAAKSVSKKRWLYWLLVIECLLIFIDLVWSGSRIAVVSMVFIVAFVLISKFRNMRNKKRNHFSKKRLKALLFILLLFQALYPAIYLHLSDVYYDELNQYSVNVTSKNFFSGRQKIWEKMNDVISSNEMVVWGTGDANYEIAGYSPHNEFIGLYYCWGILTSIAIYFYIYRIGNKCIDNTDSDEDMIILAAFMALILCTSHETFLYAPYFFVFEKLLVAILLNKKDLYENKK